MTSIQQKEIQTSGSRNAPQRVANLRGVRYQVKDVQRAIAFYTHTLCFNLDMQRLPAFGQVSIGDFNLLLMVPELRDRGRCPMAGNKSRADGTAWFFRCKICLRGSLN